MTRKHVILAVLSLLFCAIAFLIGVHRGEDGEEAKPGGNEAHDSSGDYTDAKSRRLEERIASRAATLRSAVEAARSAQTQKEEKPTPWQHVPGELDALLLAEPEDENAGVGFRAEVEAFIADAELEGTSVLETRCGRSICRARLVHTTEDDYLKYYRHYGLSPWVARSNYFSAQPSGDGAWGSYTWAGVAGYELPLKEIHDRHVFLGD